MNSGNRKDRAVEVGLAAPGRAAPFLSALIHDHRRFQRIRDHPCTYASVSARACGFGPSVMSDGSCRLAGGFDELVDFGPLLGIEHVVLAIDLKRLIEPASGRRQLPELEVGAGQIH